MNRAQANVTIEITVIVRMIPEVLKDMQFLLELILCRKMDWRML